MKVLLLNASYEPLKTISWQRAMVLAVNDKIEVLEHYPDFKIRSATQEFPTPAVARLLARVRWNRWDVKFSRPNIYKRDAYTCQYCRRQMSAHRLTFDHVVPRSRGGPTTWQNITTACKTCNQKKGNRTPEEAGMPLLAKPYIPRVSQWGRIDARPAHKLWTPYLF